MTSGIDSGIRHTGDALDRRTPYVPSPLLYGDALYFLRHYPGILTRLDPIGNQSLNFCEAETRVSGLRGGAS